MRKKQIQAMKIGAFALLVSGGLLLDSSVAEATTLSRLLPSAGINLTLMDGMPLSRIQEEAELMESTKTNSLSAVTKKMENADSLLTMKSALSSSLMKNQIQAVAGVAREYEAISVEPGAKTADASGGAMLSDANNSAALQDEEKSEIAAGLLSTAVETDDQEIDAEYKADEPTASRTANRVIDNAKAIETTKSAIEVAALQAANMSEEDKAFSKLVIAKVNNYVNVRSVPSEDGEVVGKLYDKSVGAFISEQDGWYEITSGSVTGFVKSEFCVTGKEAIQLAREVGTRIATVETSGLRVRKDSTTESDIIGRVPKGEELVVTEEGDGWVKVSIEEGEGWISAEFVSLRTDFVKAESKAEEEKRLAKEAEAKRKAQQAAKEKASKKAQKGSNNKNYNSASSYLQAGDGSSAGNAVAQYALQFVGNPYVYGGTSLTNGADCSGFVMSVYNNFGVSLPHSSSADRSVGSTVGSLEEAAPGDLVCYSGHVALYIGGGQIVHASTSRTGIIVSNAGYKKILSIRRIF